jgi:DNA-binding NarL/FixJ family response regulator
MPVTLLIADDHPIFCAGVRALIDAEPGFALVGQAGDGAEALELAVRLKPDVALLDFAMPRMSGLEALRELNAFAIETRVVMLTAAISRTQIVETLRFGARGVVLKEAATDLLFRAIRAVMAGQYWVGSESITDLVQYMREQSSTGGDSRPYRLTPREQQVVAAVAGGLTNRDIAQQFSVSEDTVKHHLSHVFDKVGVSNRLELALFAIEKRILQSRQAR